jgi:hypothetical protein
MLSSEPQEKSVPLVGVSAGALVSSAVAAGIDPEEGMTMVLQVSRETKSRYLDVLHPGYSLIDAAERHFAPLMRSVNQDRFLQRIQSNRKSLLRIGLTDRRVFPPVAQNPKAFIYVDEFRDMEDVIAACTLSSYIPGITGPVLGSQDKVNWAIYNAALRMNDMIQAGCVKKASGEPVEPLTKLGREICWDGGLANTFPFIDSESIIVTPLAASFEHNKSINPSIEYEGKRVRSFPLTPSVRIHMTPENAASFRQIVLSSDDAVLNAKFTQGYDNAYSFLSRHNLISAFRSSSPPIRTG